MSMLGSESCYLDNVFFFINFRLNTNSAKFIIIESIGEKFQYFFRSCIGCEIPILYLLLQKKISNTSSDKINFKVGIFKFFINIYYFLWNVFNHICYSIAVKYKILNISPRFGEAGKDQIKKIEDVTRIILENRGLKTKKEIEEFLNPRLEKVTAESVGIDSKQLKIAISRIQKAIKNKEKIVVFGDYDVDGICGTAILWETLNSLGAEVMPYIPHRIEEGYGLSEAGIRSVILNLFQDHGSSGSRSLEMLKQVQHDKKKKLIITVDNGIVANKAVDFANKNNIDVIITDHHVPSKKLPDAFAIVHTTKLCGAGVAWMLSNVILNSRGVMPNSFRHLNTLKNKTLKQVQGDNNKQVQHDKEKENHLELVALATVADLVPLVSANRTLLKFGLEQLQKTQRIGLKELFLESGVDSEKIGVYEIGHIIAPRLNAMGRLENAMDSLRLLCTNNKERANKLAQLLGSTNRERQTLTIETSEHAKSKVKSSKLKVQSLLFISDESYQQGVIGLVAGKLVEEFYKPSIVVSIGEKYSKASARSVSGFNIIEFIRSASELLVDAGVHPMAAGFTVETSKLLILQKTLEEKAELILTEDLLIRSLKIDCELPLEFIDINLYESLQKLAPFGMGNPEPVFISRNVVIEDIRLVGMEGKHLKINVKCQMSNVKFSAIGFGMGKMFSKIKIGDRIDIAYTIDINEWNGEQRLQLKIKDIMN